jgi:hypothetical protein
LAQAERVKAILPLCVGIATTASAFALLAPMLAQELTKKYAIAFATEIYLFFPLVAVLAAAIAGLATEEVQLEKYNLDVNFCSLSAVFYIYIY